MLRLTIASVLFYVAVVFVVGCSDQTSVSESTFTGAPSFIAIDKYEPIANPSAAYACFSNTRSRLKNPSEFNISVAFGYSDTVDEGYNLVADGFSLKELGYLLTQKCTYNYQGFCNFEVIGAEENKIHQYTRKLRSANGEEIKVNIFAVNGSYSMDNFANKNASKQSQNEKTKLAEQFFAWSFQNSDTIFYEGHSRDGGGPDFAPPIQTSTGKVNYPWYRSNKPGLKKMLGAIDSASIKPMSLGLFSCNSKVHFSNVLSQHLPETNFVLGSKVVVASQSKLALFRTLESVLNFECSNTLKQRLIGSEFIFE